MCVLYVEPCSPQIPSEEQQQAKGSLGPESAGERWKLQVWSESSVMRCRPLSPSLGTHTPSPPSHFVEIPHCPSLSPLCWWGLWSEAKLLLAHRTVN